MYDFIEEVAELARQIVERKRLTALHTDLCMQFVNNYYTMSVEECADLHAAISKTQAQLLSVTTKFGR